MAQGDPGGDNQHLDATTVSGDIGNGLDRCLKPVRSTEKKGLYLKESQHSHNSQYNLPLSHVLLV